jgi:hypothetical protein
MMKFFRQFFLSLAGLLFTLLTVAQDLSIKGTVVDPADGSALIGAIAQIQKDSLTLKAMTDENGLFTFSNLAPGIYKLEISYLGFLNYQKDVEVKTAPVVLDKILLKSDVKVLKDIEVVAQVATATQKGDTTQYNAAAYKTNPDATSEDLIQKMPGVVVTDGKVQAQGEQVKQVLVDGKPFFGDDPSAVLRNLPAEVIDKIQVFDRQSDQSRLTGFDDGNTSKTINIITKADKKNGVFGKFYGGYGYNNKFKAGASVNYFKNDRKVSLLYQSNNINEQNFSSEDLVGALGSSGGGGRGGGGGGGRGMGGPGGGPGGGNSNIGNFLVDQSGGINTTHAVGVNYADKWFKKVDMSGSYFFNYTDNNNMQSINRLYALTTDSGRQTYNQTNTANSVNMNHRANFRFEYQIDTMNTIIFTPKLSIQINNGSSITDGQTKIGDYALSTVNSNYRSNLFGLNSNNDFLYTHKFAKAGRTLSINLNGAYTQNDGKSYLLSNNSYYSDSLVTDSLNQYSDLKKSGYTASGNITYTEPLGKKSILQINYGGSLNHNDADKKTYNYDGAFQEYNNLDTFLSNTFSSNYYKQNAGLGYRFNSQKIMFSVNANYQWALLKNDQQYPFTTQINRSFHNVLPSAMFRYSIDKKSNLRIFYRSSTNQPSVDQLQSVVNNSNPLLLSTGNSNLKQDFQNDIFTRYSFTDPTKSITFFAMLGGSVTQNYIGKSTTIARVDTVVNGNIALQRGAQLSQPVNLNGYFSLRSFFNYGMPLKFMKSNLNLNAGATFTRTPGLINNVTNYANTPAVNAGIVISSNISTKIDFTVSTNSNVSFVKNTLQTSSNNRSFNQNTKVKVYYNFWKGMFAQVDLSHQYNQGLSAGYNTNFVLLTPSIGYKFLKEKQAEFRLVAFDVLNQNKSVTRTNTETYIEDTKSNVLTRYVMLTFTYNLRKFGI